TCALPIYMLDRIPEVHPAPVVEFRGGGEVEPHVTFAARQPQQEPDLLLPDADKTFVAADGAFRQAVAQPPGRGTEHLDMPWQEAGLLVQLPVHGLDRRLVAVHSPLGELPAVTAHPARPEQAPIAVHQHDTHVGAVAIRIDHRVDSGKRHWLRLCHGPPWAARQGRAVSGHWVRRLTPGAPGRKIAGSRWLCSSAG